MVLSIWCKEINNGVSDYNYVDVQNPINLALFIVNLYFKFLTISLSLQFSFQDFLVYPYSQIEPNSFIWSSFHFRYTRKDGNIFERTSQGN